MANEDPDNDGLINAEEFEAGTNPNIQDTDTDGVLDGHDLYPLVADPSIPPSFRVAVPSWEEQYDSQDPDWSAVDYTTVELRWDSSANTPSNYIIERRADNDLWQAVATVSGSTTTHEDTGLVANRHYQYRIRAVKNDGATQVSSAFETANYRVPLNLRLHAKTASSSQSKWSYGHAEFTNPSTPPQYYFTKADVSSYTQSSSSSNSSSSGSGNYSFTRTYDPMLKKTDETGSYSTSSQSNSWGTDWSSSSTSSATSSYSSLVQNRSPGVSTSITQRSSVYDTQSNSSNSWSSPSSSSSGHDRSYLLQGSYVPTDGPALWAGSDFDMSRGTVGYSGSSSSSTNNNPSSGSNTTTSASATATGTGSAQWSGTSTNSSGNTTSITYPPYTSWWSYSNWFYGLQSTTQTERSYSQTSGSTQYQGTQTLSGEYTTEALIATAVAHMSDYPPEWIEDYWGWGYYDWGYWGPYDYWGYDDWYYYYDYGYYWWGWTAAHWSLSDNETSFSTGKFKYKLSANPSASTTMHWVEVFVPYDDYDTPEINESLDVEIVAERTWELTGAENESPEFEIDPTQNPPTRNGYYTILLLPFELGSDLNNNGKIDGTDSQLKTDGAKSDASDEAKEKATEYLFVNDDLSNGLWDKDDDDAPEDETEDDDAQELKTICAATWGAIWFEHPIIDKLAFYKTKECNAADKVTFPFALSATNKLPEKLYVRAEEVTVQVEGDLVMKFGKADKTETWAEDKLKFTVVRELGDKKYFHAVRDYILENNTEMFAHRKGYPADDPDTEFWICAMREEATKMEAVESFHRGAGKLYGIGDVVSNYPNFTVVTNGNQVFFSDGWEPAPPFYFDEDHVMSDKCHGRLIYAGVSSPTSSDNTTTSTVPPGSPLAGPEANYISQGTSGPFTLALGRVPNDPYPWMGLGGLSTNYGDPTRANLPQTIVGYAPVLEDGKGVIFTASQPPMGGGNPGFPSGGHALEFAADANRSGVPAMPGAPAGRYKLLILDSGRTSVALAHVAPNGVLDLQFSGTKHSVGYPYYVNTYLGFKSTRPRSNQ